MERETIHVVLLPLPAFGHMMPFHQLAIALAEAGVHVSFISTPKNTQRLPKPPQNLSPKISFVSLPLPISDSSPLPKGAEATVDLISGEQLPYLIKAFDLLHKPLEKFVVEHSPDWLIIDLLTPWATDVGKDCGVPVLGFSPFSAATCLFWAPSEYLTGDGQKRVRSSLESLTTPPEWVTFPSSVAYYSFEAAGKLNEFYGDDALGISPAKRLAKTINASQAMAIRHSRELGGEYLSLYAKLIGKPAIPAGLLPPEKPKERQITGESWVGTFKWLDLQEPRSVVFVGFGSECRLSREQVYEIAYGLEESELPFLWALRKPLWAKDDVDVLPPGFSERTFDHKRQKVCFGWAPQREILAHPSIGGSLFHAGWGSTIEALQFGHCLVVLPFMVDQGLNARFLVEKGLAFEVERGDHDGSFERSDIARALRGAMVGKEGEGMRARSRDVAAVIGDREIHEGYIAGLVEFLKAGLRNRNNGSSLHA
ncbi:putative UDP-rhamnose:rhamnosyltransferase 1 [Rhododendron vialii]|uniref:putative UDP-rhamnose:rhamnosyltransferase 1 n=1 Tax=Rhododendron vialii TaxID=182163 RepID=UPI00265EC747|nr:putative UDP-rhamnose:rhamnosyltransferase 1 [Rhododendron vialii]